MRTLSLILFLAAGANVFAQSSSHFNISRSVVASGGTTFSSSAHFQLGSTVAQPLAAVPSSAHYSIQGGFWIQPAPILFAPAQSGTNFLFSFQSEPGKTYVVSGASSLNSPNWQTLATVAGNGAVLTVSNSVSSSSLQIFRLIEQ